MGRGSCGASTGSHRCSFATCAAYASALGSRTSLSAPRRKDRLSHPSSSTGLTGRSAHWGNCEETNRVTKDASISTSDKHTKQDRAGRSSPAAQCCDTCAAGEDRPARSCFVCLSLVDIDASLVTRLVSSQFPQWADLPVSPVELDGWDNRSFRLGADKLVRLPSAEAYAAQVAKEQRWLPVLAPQLPLPIPVPLAIGHPGAGYPWNWSVYGWIEGETAETAPIRDLGEFATALARFLNALQRVDAVG